MLQKISLNIDVNKLDKSRLVEREYTNKAGEKVKQKELKVDVIPLKEKTVLKAGDGWKLMKVGFVAETPTQEERTAKTKTNIVGTATQFETVEKQPSFDRDSRGRDIKPEEIDF